jgi:hypothetical protein
MEMKKVVLILLYINLFLIPSFSQCLDSLKIENFYKIKIGYLGPFARSIAMFSPNSVRGNIPITINFDRTAYLFDDVIQCLFLRLKRIPSGRVYKNQYSNAKLLFDFYYSSSDSHSNNIYSIFINYDGTYLLNESEIEYKAEKEMISFLKKYFYFLYDSYIR